jgi:hypothetical protein
VRRAGVRADVRGAGRGDNRRMSDSLGDEAPGRYAPHVYKKIAKYLVVIDAAGQVVARLFDDERRPLAEFDASSEEVALMTQGLVAAMGATGREWDAVLGGHSRDERRAAEVYTLDV